MSSNLDIISPYKNIIQHTKIQIHPHQMNSDIKNNMKIVLQKKVEHKCNNNGYIDEIFDIEEYSDGIMIPENLSGSINYDIKYSCRLCLPLENSIIIGQIKAINYELVCVSNGPITIFIPQKNIDTNIWNVSNDITHIKSNNTLKISDYVKVLITRIKINKGAKQIICMGKLVEFATNNEKIKFFGTALNEEENQDNSENDNDNNNDNDKNTNFII